MWYYSASSRGFFHDGIHATMPGDSVEITDERHAELLQAQAGGMVIEPGEGGLPEAVARAVTGRDAAERLKAQAREALDRSDITVIRCVEHGVAVPEAWRGYRAELRAIAAGTSEAAELPALPGYPEGT